MQELLEKHALAKEMLGDAELEVLRAQMDEARAKRLQPHYVELFFRQAFGRLGGRIARREKGRYEIGSVPQAIRQRDSRSMRRTPVVTRYERIAFDPANAHTENRLVADLVTPGHPLFDAVVDCTVEQLQGLLARGSVLVDPGAAPDAAARLLVAVAEEVTNGRGDAVTKRLGYVYVTADGAVCAAGSAPYLDFEPIPRDVAVNLDRYRWQVESEAAAARWIVEHDLPEYAEAVRVRIRADVERTRAAVTSRLRPEVNRLYSEAGKASEDEAAGRKVRVRAATLEQRAEELEGRLARRVADLSLEGELTLRPPHVLGVALVLPRSALGDDAEPALPPAHARSTREVERGAVDAVLTAGRALGRQPEEMPPNNPGYDIRSVASDGHVIHLEVKGRLAGAEDFFVTFNEVLHGKNAAPRYRLALVSVSPEGADRDEIRYLADPFARVNIHDFSATGISGKWPAEWARGAAPF